MGHERGPCEIVKEVQKIWELDAWGSLYIQNSAKISHARILKLCQKIYSTKVIYLVFLSFGLVNKGIKLP
jgi:hypothetical protein